MFFCLVTLDDLESGCGLRVAFVKRMLESMHIVDYQRFLAPGGNIKKVNFFNNCKGEPLFSIPHTQINYQ